VEFLLVDLDTALTFLEVADATNSKETRTRNRQNARTAYDAVLRLLARLTPTDEERSLLDAKLAELKNRLDATDFSTDSEKE
jgi:hypothetical protein